MASAAKEEKEIKRKQKIRINQNNERKLYY